MCEHLWESVDILVELLELYKFTANNQLVFVTMEFMIFFIVGLVLEFYTFNTKRLIQFNINIKVYIFNLFTFRPISINLKINVDKT